MQTGAGRGMGATKVNQSLGIVLIMAQWFFFFLGALLLFNTSLILMGNLCFILGLCLLIGSQNALNFFFNKKTNPARGGVLYRLVLALGQNPLQQLLIKLMKIKTGSIFYLSGLLTILLFSTTIGFVLQVFGLFKLFQRFIPFVYGFVKKNKDVPIIGRFLEGNKYTDGFIELISKKDKSKSKSQV